MMIQAAISPDFRAFTAPPTDDQSVKLLWLTKKLGYYFQFSKREM
jgi:hypothetical protein